MSAPKITIQLTEVQHDGLARLVAEGAFPTIEAAVAAAVDEAVHDHGAAMSALDDPAFVAEIRRRAADPPEMFEDFDADEMMAWLDARAAARKKGTGAA